MINPIIINETWEYWENKFKGMSKAQIEAFWENERKEAMSELSIGMDWADDSPGIRGEIVEEDYNRYQKAIAIHEGREQNIFETWEYWENKFKGTSESEIAEFWEQERQKASSDLYKSIDNADGVPGIHARIVELQYNRYVAAKKSHDAVIEKSGEASLSGINEELEAVEKIVDNNKNIGTPR